MPVTEGGQNGDRGRSQVKIFYLVQTEMLTGGVIEAQVIGALRGHSRSAGQPETKLIFLEPARVAFGRRARATLGELRRSWPDGKMVVVPYVSRVGPSSAGKFLAAYLAAERYSSSEIVFHCRGPEASLTAAVARRLLGKGRIVFDVRGPSAEEAIHRLGHPWPNDMPAPVDRAYRQGLEKDAAAARVADRVFTVSEGLKRYAVERLAVAEEKVLVVPSCVEDLAFDPAWRDRARAEWGVAGSAPVLVYSGRLGREREPEHMLRLLRAVLRVRPDAKLVLLSYLNQLTDLGALLSRSGVPESAVLVRQYPRDEVVRMLGGGDVGLLFCEPAARYEDWFPIKFPEYLSAGLPVALNSLVGDLPGLVERRGVGWVVDVDLDEVELNRRAEEIAAQVTTERDRLRERALAVCSELYMWRTYVPSIRRAYGLASS
jgi:glycosyltransferase involved in cell wall biosynthesis